MRTAQEIICDGLSDKLIEVDDLQFKGSKVKELINTARKEAIEDVAEMAQLKYGAGVGNLSVYVVVDKQSILSIINELQ